MAYLAPWATGLVSKTLEIAKEQLTRVDGEQLANGAKALTTSGFEAAKAAASTIDVKEAAKATTDWASHHRGFIASTLSSTVVTAAVGANPGLAWVLPLNWMGFTSQGVAAGGSSQTSHAACAALADASRLLCGTMDGMGGPRRSGKHHRLSNECWYGWIWGCRGQHRRAGRCWCGSGCCAFLWGEGGQELVSSAQRCRHMGAEKRLEGHVVCIIAGYAVVS